MGQNDRALKKSGNCQTETKAMQIHIALQNNYTQRRLKQGAILSPMLFSVFYDNLFVGAALERRGLSRRWLFRRAGLCG